MTHNKMFTSLNYLDYVTYFILNMLFSDSCLLKLVDNFKKKKLICGKFAENYARTVIKIVINCVRIEINYFTL